MDSESGDKPKFTIKRMWNKVVNYYKIQRLKDLIVYHEECYEMLSPEDSLSRLTRKQHKASIKELERQIENLKRA